MTEVELAQACAEAMYARDQATQGLGIRLLEAGPGQACLRMPVRADMIQGHGTCHGGFLFALADSAFAFACNSHDQATVALGCSIDYLAPALRDDVLTARASRSAARAAPACTTSASRTSAVSWWRCSMANPTKCAAPCWRRRRKMTEHTQADALIIDAVRTPIGRYAGALSGVRADDLAAIPLKALIQRHPELDWKPSTTSSSAAPTRLARTTATSRTWPACWPGC